MHKSLSKNLLTDFKNPKLKVLIKIYYLGFEFEKPSPTENKWIDDLLEQHANKFITGWNTIEVIVALEVPLLNT